jgi:nucleotide-binding universal stress UspA family protein
MKKILVAVDFSEGTGRLVSQASDLGRALGGKIWVVHVTSDALQAAYESTQFYDFSSEYVITPPGDVEMARTLCAEEYKREHESLLNISARLRENGLDAQAMLLKGDAAELILEKARELKVDIILMGSHGHGLLRKMLVGSVTEAVLRKASCGVLIVPVKEQVPIL